VELYSHSPIRLQGVVLMHMDSFAFTLMWLSFWVTLYVLLTACSVVLVKPDICIFIALGFLCHLYDTLLCRCAVKLMCARRNVVALVRFLA
jgi:hypothetical protein